MSSHIYCDGLHRRDFLRIGGLTGVGLSLAQYLQIAEAGQVGPAKAKAAIFVRLSGGPSHMDTFDLKPDAPESHRGEFREISTNVPGVRFSEHLPKLAKCADKFAILRGVSHTLADHRLGTKYMTTGNRPLPSLEYPGFGSVVSRELSGPADLPTFVAVPGGEETTGYMGVEYGALNTGQTPKPGKKLEIRGISINGGVTLADLDRRQNLLKKFDHAFDSLGNQDKLLVGLDRFTQRAFAMIRSPKVRTAFDLSQESKAITNMFTEDSFPQSCLLAARLVETGVRFVTVSFTGWDTHDVSGRERGGVVVEQELDGSSTDDKDFVDVAVLVCSERGAGRAWCHGEFHEGVGVVSGGAGDQYSPVIDVVLEGGAAG